jgi:hypothetical protein
LRINARLDEETQAQLAYITLTTGNSTSHVVRESLALYYVKVKQQQPRPSRLLAMVGKGDSGRTDVASNVKAHLTEILEKKLGLAPSGASLRLGITPPPSVKGGKARAPRGVKTAKAAEATASRRKK